MKTYDVIVIGAGVATAIVFKALSHGLTVALVDGGQLGGTCLNVGCVPSKTFIYPADVIAEIQSAGRLGITARIDRIRFDNIGKRVRKIITDGRSAIGEAIADTRKLDFYHEHVHFAEPDILETGREAITGRKLFIASGARTAIPPVKGLGEIAYLTNENLPGLRQIPASLTILGGGYIAVEYGHFFAAMGTRVTILQKGDRILPLEEPEISDALKRALSRRMKILTGVDVLEFRKTQGGVSASYRSGPGRRVEAVVSERVLVAAGRRSNADALGIEKSGIRTDERDYIQVNDFLETNRKNVWALGDAIGKQMFTHAGDREAVVAWHNAAGGGRKMKMDFSAVPHAVFTYPPIASIGLTESEAGKSQEILVGKAGYSDIVRGDAMVEKEGFAKAIVSKKTGRILGFHIIGPQAPELIQEVAYVVAHRETAASILETMHIFPTLSELIPEALNSLK